MNAAPIFNFLNQLKANNNRDWFLANKTTYKTCEHSVKSFFAEINEHLSETDRIESYRLMRIYRDVRFSKDKTPYNPRFGGGFKRATAALRGGYFLRLEPQNSVVGGGFYGPNKDDLKRIRQEFETDDTAIRTIINSSTFKKNFGHLKGESLKTAPRGFDVNHHAIDLIRMKSFYVARHFSDEEVCASNFQEEVIKTYLALRPFFDYMSDVLTTNLNGESII